MVDRLNKFSNACLKDDSYDVDDAVKDLSDVVFGVAEATSPVYRFTCIENSKHSQEKKNKCFDKSCFELNREVLRLRGTFLVIRKAFKKLVKTKKRYFKEFLLQKIASFESYNSMAGFLGNGKRMKSTPENQPTKYQTKLMQTTCSPILDYTLYTP